MDILLCVSLHNSKETMQKPSSRLFFFISLSEFHSIFLFKPITGKNNAIFFLTLVNFIRT